jgi:ATP-dependent DNA helicase RecQ
MTWKSILEKSARENAVDASFLPNALKHLNDMNRYCHGAVCRHRSLVEYFGQRNELPGCKACDLCLGDTELVPDPVVVAQKILSCVARVQERFGIGYVTAVLRGESNERVLQFRHNQLSTFGLLKVISKTIVREWIYQLIDQEVLLQEGDEYPILRLNEGSWEVMRKQRAVRLLQPVRKKKNERPARSRADVASWEDVDHGLFEELRLLRRKLADQRQVQPYMVFGDATLRELARIRPSTLDGMRRIYGVGQTKLADFGTLFLQVVLDFCREHRLETDLSSSPWTKR